MRPLTMYEPGLFGGIVLLHVFVMELMIGC